MGSRSRGQTGLVLPAVDCRQCLPGTGDLLLQSLSGGFVGSFFQHGLHLFHHCPVASSVVEHPDSPVSARHQVAAASVKSQVCYVLSMNTNKALLLFSSSSVVHNNACTTGDGCDMSIRGQGNVTRFCYFTLPCQKQVWILLLLIFHICVPEFPCTILRNSCHPTGRT